MFHSKAIHRLVRRGQVHDEQDPLRGPRAPPPPLDHVRIVATRGVHLEDK